jgi:hypothetical protein
VTQTDTSAVARSVTRFCRASSASQSLHPGSRETSSVVDETEPHEPVVQFVGIGRIGPRFLAHPRDRLGVEAASSGRVLRCEPATAHHRLRAPLFQWRIVEIRVGRADSTSSASGDGSVRSRATTP